MFVIILQKGARKKYGEKCDIYSLGIVLFDMLHQHGQSLQEQQEILDDLKEGKVPEEVRSKFPQEVSVLKMDTSFNN